MTVPFGWLERARRLLPVGMAVFMAVLAGCPSDPVPGPHHARSGSPPSPVVPLVGSAALLDGQLMAKIEVGPAHGPGGKMLAGGTDAPDESGGMGGKGLTGGVQGNGGNRGVNAGGEVGYDLGGANVGMGMGMGGPSLGLGLGGGGGRGGGGPGGKPPGAGDDEGRPAPQRGASNMGAPATIYLRLTNTGSTRIDFAVTDFLSPMGNFVVLPERMSLGPGQWVEAEPMTSQLLMPGTVPEVKLTVRAGDRQDSKKILLQVIPAAPPAPLLAPPPSAR